MTYDDNILTPPFGFGYHLVGCNCKLQGSSLDAHGRDTFA